MARAPRGRAWGTIRRARGRYVVRFHHDGRTYDRPGGTSWAGADKRRRQARTLLEAGTPLADVLAHVFGDVGGSGLTFRDAAPLYLAHASTRKRESTLRGDVRRLRILTAAPWAGKALGAIRAKDLLPWIERRRQRDGASGATVNRDLALASALYRWAIRAGHVEGNPIRKVERFSEAGRARETYLTADEARALLDACSTVLRPLVLAALHTGARRGELLGLRWRAVDLARGELLVERAKTKPRTVPLTGTLRDALAALKAERPRPALDGSDHVFTDRDGRPLGEALVRHAFGRTVERCEGIPLAKRGAVTFHALRHTCASLLVAAGVPLFDVAKVLGHSTLAVTMRYAHHAPEAGARAAQALDGALAQTPSRGARKGG